MSFIKEECHGHLQTLLKSSNPLLCPTRCYKFFWHVKNGGFREAFDILFLRIRRFLVAREKFRERLRGNINVQNCEVLMLQPGDMVRVKSEKEILVTLDRCHQNKGLAWMPIMSRHCGKVYRVYKRVDKIVLESTGEIRKLKNTVLLQGAICEGIYGCDRSCFHFWREVWLEKVEADNLSLSEIQKDNIN